MRALRKIKHSMAKNHKSPPARSRSNMRRKRSRDTSTRYPTSTCHRKHTAARQQPSIQHIPPSAHSPRDPANRQFPYLPTPPKQQRRAAKQNPLLQLPQLWRRAGRKSLRVATKQLFPRFAGPQHLPAADTAGFIVEVTDLFAGAKPLLEVVTGSGRRRGGGVRFVDLERVQRSDHIVCMRCLWCWRRAECRSCSKLSAVSVATERMACHSLHRSMLRRCRVTRLSSMIIRLRYPMIVSRRLSIFV